MKNEKKYVISLINKSAIKPDKSCSRNIFLIDDVYGSNDLNDIAQKCLEYHVAPGLFQGYHKTQDNFHSSYWLGFDFDNGTSVESIQDCLSNTQYQFMILASKNHMKDKRGQGIKPRFHVFIPLSNPITNRDMVKEVSELFAKRKNWLNKLDTQCFEAARYYYLHSEILCVKQHDRALFDPTNLMSIAEDNIRLRNKKHLIKSKLQKFQHTYSDDEEFKMDLFIKTHTDLCNRLSTPNDRHNATTVLCGKIKRMGFGVNEAMAVFDRCYSGNDRNHHIRTINKLMNK